MIVNYWYGGYPATGPYGSYGNMLMWGAYVTYGTLLLTQSSPPQSFVEPVSLEEAKDFLKVPQRSPAEPAEDALIQSLISAARSYAENEQGCDLVRKQWDLVYDYWMSYRIELPPGPLVSVDLMQYTHSDGTVTIMTEGVDYIVDKSKNPACILPPYNVMWPVFTPQPSSAILTRFTSGYAHDDPYWLGDGAVVKEGMRYLISNWYNLRLPVGTAASEWPLTASATLKFGSRSRIY
jgi:uncharacterized phiE125 gp8 family phage protein